MDIELQTKLIIILVSLIFLSWTVYKNTQSIQLLKNVAVEINLENNKLEMVLFSGRRLTLDKDKISTEKFSFSFEKEKFNLTNGRMISFEREKYFIPDSEFGKI